jgi:microcystin degradation protein MlrC
VAEKGGQEAAEHLARYVWEKKGLFKLDSNSPEKALAMAKEEKKDGYIVINEASDNPGGGCPGDGTHLLRQMLKENLPRSIFGYMVDEACVEAIFRHRPGDRVDLTLGGKHEKIFGEPLTLKDALIISLSDGVFHHTSPNLKGIKTSLGKSARIRVGNVDIVVGSNRNQTFDDRPFAVTGADLREWRYVGLKSTHHFRSFFEGKAARIISCDPPGLSASDLGCFDYQKIPRPVFPLDKDTEF